MFRVLFELLITIFAVVVARAVLSSILKNAAKAGMGAFQNRSAQGSQNRAEQRPSGPQVAGELHKDPVCGTYVAESAAFRRQVGGRTFFYCSEACSRKHV
ncbi:MAG: hypothetical protein JO319_16715 [Acidobacteriaceae bacterium]|nr:hypothetical protein [Acidobacteriaceae bacterium]